MREGGMTHGRPVPNHLDRKNTAPETQACTRKGKRVQTVSAAAHVRVCAPRPHTPSRLPVTILGIWRSGKSRGKGGEEYLPVSLGLAKSLPRAPSSVPQPCRPARPLGAAPLSCSAIRAHPACFPSYFAKKQPTCEVLCARRCPHRREALGAGEGERGAAAGAACRHGYNKLQIYIIIICYIISDCQQWKVKEKEVLPPGLPAGTSTTNHR